MQVGDRFVVAVASSDVQRGPLQSVIQQTERRKRREWSLGPGDKWSIQRWRTQLLVARVTCKDMLLPQGELARYTLRRGVERIYVTYDLHHNRLGI